ncbi:MAG TPA: Wzz/FepE/Etk N-terminal domain-containing protein, partial [Desulfomonilaceae bacterium]|nr:Wzz/FepE/Etk N-terminal domain-containing protein [Desulfomonilaceae bacterium]
MKSGDRHPKDTITLNLEVDPAAVEGRARIRSEDSRPYGNGSYEFVPTQELRLKDYLRIIEKRKGIVSLIFVVVLGLAALYAFTSIPVYRAEAVLEFGKDSTSSINNVGEVIAQSLGSSDLETFATQAGILKSKFLAEALIDRLNLMESPEFSRPPGFLASLVDRATTWAKEAVLGQTTEVQPHQKKEKLIKDIVDRVTVKRENQSRLIRLMFDSKDPEMAKIMLQNYIDLYMGQNLAKRRMVSKDAGIWLRSELTKAEDKLVNSMKDLVQFTNDHGIVSLDEGSNHVITFFNKAAEGLVKSKEQRVQLEAFQKDGIKDWTVLPSEAKPDDLKTLKEKVGVLESEYNNMKEIYADDYPKLVLLRKQIAFLKEKLTEYETRLVSSVLETARTQEVLQQEAFEKAKQEAMDNNSLGVQSSVLKKEVETNGDIYK